MPATWSLEQAIEVCRKVEAICPKFGCHVALTGGTLYKDGPRKDLDLLFYRIRQWDHIPQDELFEALEKIGLKRKRGFGWCFKFEFTDLSNPFEVKPVDIFFPEEQGGDEYPGR
jgi:hypothetical protein